MIYLLNNLFILIIKNKYNLNNYLQKILKFCFLLLKLINSISNCKLKLPKCKKIILKLYIFMFIYKNKNYIKK